MARPARRAPWRAHRCRHLIRLLAPGDPAPDFTLTGSDGRIHHLGTLLRDSRILLVFYPGNDTPG
ncbi:MAG TPA: redoxin domain-containing protein [Gemmatimonadales bacterium]|nr:redoxin domain-containing protein [Gemmatimonadales bacterium]